MRNRELSIQIAKVLDFLTGLGQSPMLEQARCALAEMKKALEDDPEAAIADPQSVLSAENALHMRPGHQAEHEYLASVSGFTIASSLRGLMALAARATAGEARLEDRVRL